MSERICECKRLSCDDGNNKSKLSVVNLGMLTKVVKKEVM